MAIVPASSTLITEDNLIVPLPLYAQIIEQPECGFWGVNQTTTNDDSCREIWSKSQRDTIRKYLSEAQWEIEDQVHYPLVSKWFADEQLFWRDPAKAKWGQVIEAGIEATDDVSLGVAINQAADPGIIGPFVTTVTDIDEIVIFHPGSENKIIPSSVVISGGSVTIEIPRCRTVLESLVDNSQTGLAYTDLTNFETTVDVKREYNDPSTNAEWVWPHRCTGNCSVSGCTDFSQDACIYIRNNEIGSLATRLATFNSTTEVWARTTAQCCPGQPEIIKLNYRAGLTEANSDKGKIRQAQDAVIRLAHSKMPDEICGCQMFTRLWRRDRNIPDIITPERAGSPFGINDGAWVAWQFAKSLRLVRGAVL